MLTVLFSPLPIGAFQGQWNTINEMTEQNNNNEKTCRRQTSWLFTSTAERLNQGLTRNKFNEWSERVLIPGTPDLKASDLTSGPHCLLYVAIYLYHLVSLKATDALSNFFFIIVNPAIFNCPLPKHLKHENMCPIFVGFYSLGAGWEQGWRSFPTENP